MAQEAWPGVVSAVVRVLGQYGVGEVVTLHGWTESEFGEHPQFEHLQWVELPLSVETLPTVVRDRRAAGFTWGRDDWSWRGKRPGVGTTFELLFCHEGDMHLSTNDRTLSQVLAHALAPLGVPLLPQKRIHYGLTG